MHLSPTCASPTCAFQPNLCLCNLHLCQPEPVQHAPNYKRTPTCALELVQFTPCTYASYHGTWANSTCAQLTTCAMVHFQHVPKLSCAIWFFWHYYYHTYVQKVHKVDSCKTLILEILLSNPFRNKLLVSSPDPPVTPSGDKVSRIVPAIAPQPGSTEKGLQDLPAPLTRDWYNPGNFVSTRYKSCTGGSGDETNRLHHSLSWVFASLQRRRSV